MAPYRVVRSVVDCVLLLFSVILITPAQTKKPNILLIMGDDISLGCICQIDQSPKENLR
jgi:hypothetical protein